MSRKNELPSFISGPSEEILSNHEDHIEEIPKGRVVIPCSGEGRNKPDTCKLFGTFISVKAKNVKGKDLKFTMRRASTNRLLVTTELHRRSEEEEIQGNYRQDLSQAHDLLPKGTQWGSTIGKGTIGHIRRN